jgi:hypothetical protein
LPHEVKTFLIEKKNNDEKGKMLKVKTGNKISEQKEEARKEN